MWWYRLSVLSWCFSYHCFCFTGCGWTRKQERFRSLGLWRLAFLCRLFKSFLIIGRSGGSRTVRLRRRLPSTMWRALLMSTIWPLGQRRFCLWLVPFSRRAARWRSLRKKQNKKEAGSSMCLCLTEKTFSLFQESSLYEGNGIFCLFSAIMYYVWS